MKNSFLATLLLLLVPINEVAGLSSEAAQLSRGRLFEALSSPSGKLTISPEVIIPEPTDPTAVLLHSNAVQTLSERLRTEAKGNSAWLSGTIESIRTFCTEQENARGNFPGPVPVIYCGTENYDHSDLVEAGASGLMVRVCDGQEISSMDDITNGEWVNLCKAAVESGMQPIPEVTLGDATAASWTEEHVEKLVETIHDVTGMEPVSVVLTVNPVDEEQEEVSLPKVAKSLGRKVPILGSVRVTAGENRLSKESSRFKDAGFTGVFLRSDCIPGFRMNPDLNVVGLFWSMCISDLKSTRSKSFEFNSRNNLNKNPMEGWAKYQQNVIDSGALGDPDDSYSIVDSAAGEYKGFA